MDPPPIKDAVSVCLYVFRFKKQKQILSKITLKVINHFEQNSLENWATLITFFAPIQIQGQIWMISL